MATAKVYGFTVEEAARVGEALRISGWEPDGTCVAASALAELEREVHGSRRPCLTVAAVRDASDAAAVSRWVHLEPARLVVAGVPLAAGRDLVASLSLALRGRVFFLPPEASELERLFHACRAAWREMQARESVSVGMKRQELEVELPTADIHVAEVAWFVTLRLADAGFCEDAERRRRTELALEEALLNAVEHGNLELDSSLRSSEATGDDPYETLRRERLADPRYARRKVRISLRVEGERAEVKVADDGRGIAVRAAPAIADPGGRGMALMERAFDTVEHEGSTLTLRCRKESADAVGHSQEG